MSKQQLADVDTKPYWSNCRPGDADCERYCQRHREDLLYWTEHIPDGQDVVSMFATDLSTRTGLSKYMVERAFQGAAISLLLPKLRNQVLEWGHLEMRYLATIDQCLVGVSYSLLPLFDEALEYFFTPQYPAETLPNLNAVKAFLEELKREHCPGYGDADAANYAFRHVEFQHTSDGMADLKGLVTKEEAEIIDTALDKTARKYDVDRVSALVKIITEKVDVKAVVNYWAEDAQSPPTYMVGAGPLIHLNNRVCDALKQKYRDLSDVEVEITNEYTPTERQKNFVRLRDGYCRFPGCSKNAKKCEIDHVVEFERNGGLTIVSNLQCLCHKHHKLKTSGDYRIFMDHNGVCRWVMPNGSLVVTLPKGPNAKISKARWGQTWESRRKRPQTVEEAEKAYQKADKEKREKVQGFFWATPPPPPALSTWVPDPFDQFEREVVFEKPWAPNPNPQLALAPGPLRLALPGPPPAGRKTIKKLQMADVRIPKGLLQEDEDAPEWIQGLKAKLQEDLKEKKAHARYVAEAKRAARMCESIRNNADKDDPPPF